MLQDLLNLKGRFAITRHREEHLHRQGKMARGEGVSSRVRNTSTTPDHER